MALKYPTQNAHTKELIQENNLIVGCVITFPYGAITSPTGAVNERLDIVNDEEALGRWVQTVDSSGGGILPRPTRP